MSGQRTTDVLTRAKARLAAAVAEQSAAGEVVTSPGLMPELVAEVERLRRIETLARAAVQPNGQMLSIDTDALKALMEAIHG